MAIEWKTIALADGGMVLVNQSTGETQKLSAEEVQRRVLGVFSSPPPPSDIPPSPAPSPDPLSNRPTHFSAKITNRTIRRHEWEILNQAAKAKWPLRSGQLLSGISFDGCSASRAILVLLESGLLRDTTPLKLVNKDYEITEEGIALLNSMKEPPPIATLLKRNHRRSTTTQTEVLAALELTKTDYPKGASLRDISSLLPDITLSQISGAITELLRSAKITMVGKAGKAHLYKLAELTENNSEANSIERNGSHVHFPSRVLP